MSLSDRERLITEQAQIIADQMNKIAQWAESEEDVRHNCNTLIDNFIKKAGLRIKGRHEYGLAGGRIDSKYAGVILEYKDPKGSGRIATPAGSRAVTKQIKNRFEDFQKEENVPPEKLFGVGLDGNTIVFVRHHGGKLEVEDPKPITRYTIERLLRALISLGAQGKSFTPDQLAADFGSDNPVAQEGVRQLYQVITETTNPKASTFFGQWKILFGEVCGYNVEGRNPKFKKLAEHYGLPSTTRPAELLFAIHSYYAIFIKFLAAEIISAFSPLGTSVIKKCVTAPTAVTLRREMEQLEQGGIWTQLGITNFLEGDLFSWYLATWDDRIAEVVRALVKHLDEYDPSTLSVEPHESRDLLKKLYQQLFPKSVRHDLGEYYTPDWLAEHVLNELGYEGNPDERLLDPACGSGTFLVIAINRIKRWFDEHRHECGYSETELVQKILKNVIGFDLNPLAVMTARTNYLIALRELLRYATRVELPVYLCDSIMTPAEYGGLFAGALGKAKQLKKTAVGEFLIPAEIATSREQMGRYAEQLEQCVRNGYSPDEFIARCKEEGLPVAEVKLHQELYTKLQELDKGNRNGIWTRIIKNAFAPLFTEPVDYVAGNPPWVNWENLPEDYRQDIAPLWQAYDLFRHKGYKAKLGGAKDDISILMTYVAHDNYLKNGGSLGFVITQSVFKTTGGGEGFRTFKYEKQGQTVRLEVMHVDDMSNFQPFEGATNRTAVFVCQKSSEPFRYPIPYVVWRKIQRGRISQDATLDEVLEATERQELAAAPVDEHQPTSPWLTAPEKALPGLRKAIGQSDYKAYAGTCGWLNGVYWVRILERLPNGDLLIENLHDVGKIKVEKVQMVIEPDLVYPLLRGRDVQRWRTESSAYIILANRTDKLAGISEGVMKSKYPKTYTYFKEFEEQLRRRSGFRQYFKPTDPFWSMYNVGPYTMSPWKVVWQRISNTLKAAVCKNIVPDNSLTFVSLGSAAEAFFLSALFNSAPSRLVVISYSVAGTGTWGSPHVLENIAIPKFNLKNSAHQTLANLSQRCHEAAAEGLMETVAKLEADIDQAAAELWGITNSELRAIQDALKAMEKPKRKRKTKGE